MSLDSLTQCQVRFVYLILLLKGDLLDASRISQLFLAECGLADLSNHIDTSSHRCSLSRLPFYLWLTAFTALVAWWIECYLSASGKSLSKVRQWVIIGILVLINVLMYSIYSIVICSGPFAHHCSARSYVFFIVVAIYFAIRKQRAATCASKNGEP